MFISLCRKKASGYNVGCTNGCVKALFGSLKTWPTPRGSSISYLASNILDKHDLNFFVNLPLRSSTKSDDVFDKLTIATRDLLFFGGSTFLSSCIDPQSLLLKPTLIEENLSSVCICFDDYHDLSSLLYPNFSALRKRQHFQDLPP